MCLLTISSESIIARFRHGQSSWVLGVKIAWTFSAIHREALQQAASKTAIDKDFEGKVLCIIIYSYAKGRETTSKRTPQSVATNGTPCPSKTNWLNNLRDNLLLPALVQAIARAAMHVELLVIVCVAGHLLHLCHNEVQE